MSEPQKDTIYVDIDDEITTIIDKVQASSNKVVALVLPKRATALQSIVNMKLLKRSSDQANKNVVLITTESGLMPLAGVVGMHVAKTPTSRPEIPPGPQSDAALTNDADTIDLQDDTLEEPIDVATPVGELAGPARLPSPDKPVSENGVETLELDNTVDSAPAAMAKSAKVKKPKKDKKLKVPDFKKFRTLLILGVILLLLLIVGAIFAFKILPKAEINVTTNASNVNTDVDFALSTSAKTFSESGSTVPAKRVQTQKTATGTANATGQKNNGERARGKVNMTLCTTSPNATGRIASGTGLSSGGKTYITQENAEFQYSGSCSGGFRFRASDVDITAQTGGASFNTSSADFSVSGRSDINSTGSASGGTDDIQTIVTQTDIDSAKSKIASEATGVQDDLQQQLEDDGLYPISATFNTGQPSTTASASVGAQATSVTVTQTTTYSLLGATLTNIKTLVDADIKSQIDASTQGILSQGITQAAFKVNETTSTGAAMTIQTEAVVGPSLDTGELASQAAGKKAGEIEAEVGSNTGVTGVEVKLSPFWVSKAPSNTSKIKVIIAKPTNSNNGN